MCVWCQAGCRASDRSVGSLSDTDFAQVFVSSCTFSPANLAETAAALRKPTKGGDGEIDSRASFCAVMINFG